MARLGLEAHVVDASAVSRSVSRCRERGVLLPTFAELAAPDRISPAILAALQAVDPNAPHPLNLFRVHWHNARGGRGQVVVPEHVVLPESLTGVPSPIVVGFGDCFPMVGAHKVLAAYGCLAPRIVTGQFCPTAHRALWPSTGNYCRGGVAISRIMGCRGVAILPEGMSRERFAWLDEWVEKPGDIVRTPGSESNVKEIYDVCNELEKDPGNIVFNQFSEFGNHLIHRLATGPALERIVESLRVTHPSSRPAAYVAASGSGGTLAAGHHLAERYGLQVVAVEALECPTLLYNGFGEHNIQGIGDKHVPLIHDVMRTDFVAAVSDRDTDGLFPLFNSAAGHAYLSGRRGVPRAVLDQLCSLGLSSICNVLAAIKTSRYLDLGPDDMVVTVATDGAGLYGSELERILRRDHGGAFSELAAAEAFGEHLLGQRTDHLLELSRRDRERIFNLGYYTWVEQQGISVEDFARRKQASFWDDLSRLPEAWDELIRAFNAETGVKPGP